MGEIIQKNIFMQKLGSIPKISSKNISLSNCDLRSILNKMQQN